MLSVIKSSQTNYFWSYLTEATREDLELKYIALRLDVFQMTQEST